MVQVAASTVNFSLFSESLSIEDEKLITSLVNSIAPDKAKQIVIHSYETLPGNENGLKEMAARRVTLIKNKLEELGVDLPVFSNFIVQTHDDAKRRVEIKVFNQMQ